MAKITDLPLECRPRERALKQGVAALGSEELLALLIGSGSQGHSALEIARDLLYRCGGSAYLSNLNLPFLLAQKGLSEATSLRLLAAFELGKRKEWVGFDRNKEEAWVFAFSESGKPLGRELLAKGKGNAVALSAKEVVRSACHFGARRILFVHTHPGGVPLPSPADLRFTDALLALIKSLDIVLLDHLILAPLGRYSFKVNGLLG